MEKGFTLIELLVTISLVAIMAVLAMPSFSSMVTNNRMAAESNDFVSSLHLARTEAVKRGEDVTICAANDALDACDSAKQWNNGWMIIIPEIPGTPLIPAMLVHAHEALGGDTLSDVSATVGTGTASQITFNRYGFAPTSARTVKLCDPTDSAENARGIIITTSGRIILASDTDPTPNQVRNDGNSVDLSCP